MLELRGSYAKHPERRPPSDDAPAEVTRLEERRTTIAEPCPPSVRDPRGVRLWDQTLNRMMELGTLSRETIPALERYVLFTVQMWKAIEAEKPIRAALSRELSALEARLLEPPARKRAAVQTVRVGTANRFARFRAETDADEALRRTDPKAWAEKCRRAAADSLKLAARLRFRKDERARLLSRKR